jgi:O-antigen/teichoic acid export membrane protein
MGSAADRLGHLARQALRRGVVDLTAASGLVLALGFLQNLVLARILGPEGLGHLSVVNTVINFANLIATAGLTTSILRYSAAQRDPGAAWAVFRSGALLVSGSSLVVLAGVVLFARSPLWVFDPVAGLFVPLAALTLPLRSLASCCTEFSQSRERMRAKALLEVTAKALLVAAVVAGSFALAFRGAILGSVLGGAVGSCVAFVYVARLRAPRPARPPVPARELLRFGGLGLLTNFFGLVLTTADVLCLSALLGDPSAVGFYSIAVVFQQLVRVPMIAYLDARFPEMTRSAEDPGALRALRLAMRRHLLAISLAATTALGATAPWLLPLLFGESYRASVLPLEILLLGQLAWSLAAAQGRSLLAAGWVEGNLISSVVSALVNVPLHLLLIPRLGAAGAACATALTQGIWALCVTLLCRRYERTRGVAAGSGRPR